MRSTILMTSVAVAALASPAFANPDRYDRGYSCTGGTVCVQEEMRLDDGNRVADKSDSNAIDSSGGTGAGGTFSASRSNDSDLGDEIGDSADEAGDDIGGVADEAGEGISNTADEAGDAIGDAADEAGDAISDAFD